MHDRQTMDDLYQRTQAWDRAILQSGYSLQTMWECEWNPLKAYRDDIQGLGLVDHLEPRDTFRPVSLLWPREVHNTATLWLVLVRSNLPEPGKIAFSLVQKLC